MTRPSTHLWRLIRWGRILARHGALRGLERDPNTPAPVRRLIKLAHIGVRVPNAIVADYRLRHERTGIDEVASLLRAWGRDVPALLVTGDSAPYAIAALHASGHDWLSKPVPAARLRSWLQAVAVLPQNVEAGSLAT